MKKRKDKKEKFEIMFQIQKEDAELSNEKKIEILENVAGFYGNLYKSQNIETQKIQKYLEDFRPNVLGKDNNYTLGH